MKSINSLTANKIPAIHQQLTKMADAAHYDLAKLERMKRWRYKEISAKHLQRIIKDGTDGTLPKYQIDPVSGRPTHKFRDAYLRPLHQAVYFNSHPQTTLVCIRMTASSPMWPYFIFDNSGVMKKLFPSFKTGKDISPAFELATGTMTEAEMKAKGITYSGWLQQQVINAISYGFIATGFLNAGMSAFIVANDDTFLVLPEDLDTAHEVIRTVSDKLQLDGILNFRNEH